MGVHSIYMAFGRCTKLLTLEIYIQAFCLGYLQFDYKQYFPNWIQKLTDFLPYLKNTANGDVGKAAKLVIAGHSCPTVVTFMVSCDDEQDHFLNL